MEANELRIGNYLQYRDSKTVAIVELIHKKHFDCRDEYGMFTPNGGYEPIPLTEEWILKCDGYWEDIISEKDAYVIDVHDELSIGWCGYLFLIISGCIVQINDTNSIYLHQLQNLYKDLKGEELTIKNQ